MHYNSANIARMGRFYLYFTAYRGRDLIYVRYGFAHVCFVAPRGDFVRSHEFTHQRDVVSFDFQ